MGYPLLTNFVCYEILLKLSIVCKLFCERYVQVNDIKSSNIFYMPVFAKINYFFSRYRELKSSISFSLSISHTKRTLIRIEKWKSSFLPWLPNTTKKTSKKCMKNIPLRVTRQTTNWKPWIRSKSPPWFLEI